MEMDTQMRRGAFIGRSLEIQEAFSLAAPSEALAAVKIYWCDLRGGMLARLGGQPAKQLMNCWGITVRDVRVSQATHKVYKRFLGSAFTTIREDLLSQWVKFYQSLCRCPLPEVLPSVFSLTPGLDARFATSDQIRHQICGAASLT